MRGLCLCGTLLLALGWSVSAVAQLPAGTTDASRTATVGTDPLRAEAAAALEKQDFVTAQRLLTTLTAQNPADARLLYNLGFAEDALNHEPEAAAAYTRAIAADGAFFEPHLAMGLLLAREGKLLEAHGQLMIATTLTADAPALKARAFRALARLDRTADPSAASADLLEALKLSPEDAEDALFAGELAEAGQDLPTAEAAYRRILAAHPDDAAAAGALGHLLLSKRRATEAEPVLTAALAAHPGDPTLTSQLAATYAAEEKLGEAISLIETLHSQPPDPALRRLLAHLYSDNKQPEKADALLVGLLGQSPHDVGLLADRGEVLLALHRFPEAEAVLNQAVAARAEPHAFATPADLGATAGDLALAASHNKNPELVLQALAIRATVLPQSPVSLFLAATAHDTLHHWKPAVEMYQKFLAAAAGKFPDQEWEASHRLLALEHRK